MRRLVLLGAPGVGKGTYGKLLAAKMKVPLIGTGALVRAEMAAASSLGREMEAFAEAGQLVPDRLLLDVVRERLLDEEAKEGFILDGFPRTISQAQVLDSFVKLDAVLNLELVREEYIVAKLLGRRTCDACGNGYNVTDVINDEEGVHMPALLPPDGSKDRCECGHALSLRVDDTKDTIKSRLDVYKRETSPLVQHYQTAGILRRFTIRKGLQDMPKLEQLLGLTL